MATTTIVANACKSFFTKYPDNLCHSPISAALLFSLIGEICDDDSKSYFKTILNDLIGTETQNDLLKKLNSHDFKIENFVFVENDYPMPYNYQQILSKLSEYKKINFNSDTHQELNLLIEKITNGVIKNFFQTSINGPIVMLNVAYFENVWGKKFKTTNREIFNSSNGPIEIDMMHCIDKSYYFENHDMQLYCKQYEASMNHMIFILPKPTSAINDFNVDTLEQYVRSSIYYEIDASNNPNLNMKAVCMKI